MTVKDYNETKNRLSKIKGIGKQGAQEALKKAEITDPQLFEGIIAISEVKAFKKKPPGNHKVSLEAVKLLLLKNGLKRTQKSIADELALKYPKHGVSSRIWQRSLPPYEWKAIQERVRGDLGEKGDVRGCKKLSDVRKKLILIQQQDKGKKLFNVKIGISNDSITVGQSIFPIELKGSGKYQYQIIRVTIAGKRQGIRIDALECLLSQ